MGNEKGKLVGYASNLQHLKELRKTYDIVCFGPLGRTFYESAAKVKPFCVSPSPSR